MRSPRVAGLPPVPPDDAGPVLQTGAVAADGISEMGRAIQMETNGRGMRGAHVIVDGEDLTVEDTVMAAVCAGRLSPDLLDHGFDTYWCVTEDGHHRLLRASELCLA